MHGSVRSISIFHGGNAYDSKVLSEHETHKERSGCPAGTGKGKYLRPGDKAGAAGRIPESLHEPEGKDRPCGAREFRKYPRKYLHYFAQSSNTGLKLDLLQRYLLIPLDIFRKCLQNRRKEAGTSRKGGTIRLKNRLEAWLAFISSDKPEDILEVVRAYPDFRELYREVFQFRDQRRELISMYSKALSILDANTVELMVELEKRKAEKQRKLLEKQKRKTEELQKVLEAQKVMMEEQDKELIYLRALLKEKGKPE